MSPAGVFYKTAINIKLPFSFIAMNPSPALSLLESLVKEASLTPDSTKTFEIIETFLHAHFTNVKVEDFSKGAVQNRLFSIGKGERRLLLCGHTDVVPARAENWDTAPFLLTEKDGKLFGRGVADMKGGIAAALVALVRFLESAPAHGVDLLITGDEEGKAINGTKAVVDALLQRGVRYDAALVMEPSSYQESGDNFRIARRGSLYGTVTIFGKSDHVAYAGRTKNVLHEASCLLCEWSSFVFEDNFLEKGREALPATSFQCTAFQSDSGAGNVTPCEVRIAFNLRTSPLTSFEDLIHRFEKSAARRLPHQCHFEWRISALSYQSERRHLFSSVRRACEEILEREAHYDAAGGTSDGRFLRALCDEVIELGLPNHSIHQDNEHVRLTDLTQLERLYLRVFTHYFTDS